MTNARQSNIEMLRIISMLMILCVHFTGATFPLPNIMSLKDGSNLSAMTKTTMECFSIIGVNCFVLISGYFGIKLSAKGIINFIFTCLFYSVVTYSIFAFIQPKTYNYSDIINSFRVLTHTDLWFIPAYFCLYLLSPIINRGISNRTKKEFIKIIIALTFINIYIGWGWQSKINPTGYNIMQLMYIYIIGRYIGLHIKTQHLKIGKQIALYIVSYILLFASTFICPKHMAYAYNSPFVIFTSISFFLIFTTKRYYNPNINFIASSAFAVYLIHKIPPIWIELKNLLINNTKNIDNLSFALYWISFVFILFMLCITIDKIRLTITNPMTKYITTKINQFI